MAMKHGSTTAKMRANITPIKKGSNRGPKGGKIGRPKGTTITNSIRHLLTDKKVRDLFDAAKIKNGAVALSRRVLDKRICDAIAEMAVKEVLKGDLGWFTALVARAEGAPTQNVNLTTTTKAPTPEEAAAAIEAAYLAEEKERAAKP